MGCKLLAVLIRQNILVVARSEAHTTQLLGET
jgi:hypothetical protein